MENTTENNSDVKKYSFAYYRTQRSIEFLNQYDKDKAWSRLNKNIKHRRITRFSLRGVAAAASIILVVGVWSLINESREIEDYDDNQVANIFSTTVNKNATLTLSSGEVINLSQGSSTIKTQSVEIVNDGQNSQLVYSGQQASTVTQYNTLTIPRGGGYELILSDGTKVWLNADSKLIYPVSFAALDKREITLYGEAYFDVEPNKTKPFIVNANGVQIKVFGTEFNINARDNSNVATTLVSGSLSVKVSENSEKMLVPNQTAFSNPKTGDIAITTGNIVQYFAWKNGLFLFENMRIDQILKEFSLWYDVDIVFVNDDIKNIRFTGCLFRNSALSELLQIIENTTHVKFDLINNTVIIKPNME